MSNGDLRDISVGSSGNNKIHNCLYDGNCGDSCPAPFSNNPNTYKTIDEVVKNYNYCHRSGYTAPSRAEPYFIADMSAAYVAYMNTIQNASSRTPSTDGALSDDIKNARNELDRDLADIYKLDIGKLSEYKTHYESTLMSGLLWGTLAATVSYYVLYS